MVQQQGCPYRADSMHKEAMPLVWQSNTLCVHVPGVPYRFFVHQQANWVAVYEGAANDFADELLSSWSVYACHHWP